LPLLTPTAEKHYACSLSCPSKCFWSSPHIPELAPRCSPLAPPSLRPRAPPWRGNRQRPPWKGSRGREREWGREWWARWNSLLSDSRRNVPILNLHECCGSLFGCYVPKKGGISAFQKLKTERTTTPRHGQMTENSTPRRCLENAPPVRNLGGMSRNMIIPALRGPEGGAGGRVGYRRSAWNVLCIRYERSVDDNDIVEYW